eukprot:223780-Chlamydomonas_euryale.AAC.11
MTHIAPTLHTLPTLYTASTPASSLSTYTRRGTCSSLRRAGTRLRRSTRWDSRGRRAADRKAAAALGASNRGSLGASGCGWLGVDSFNALTRGR